MLLIYYIAKKFAEVIAHGVIGKFIFQFRDFKTWSLWSESKLRSYFLSAVHGDYTSHVLSSHNTSKGKLQQDLRLSWKPLSVTINVTCIWAGYLYVLIRGGIGYHYPSTVTFSVNLCKKKRQEKYEKWIFISTWIFLNAEGLYINF
jgi:hypothetical protein